MYSSSSLYVFSCLFVLHLLKRIKIKSIGVFLHKQIGLNWFIWLRDLLVTKFELRPTNSFERNLTLFPLSFSFHLLSFQLTVYLASYVSDFFTIVLEFLQDIISMYSVNWVCLFSKTRTRILIWLFQVCGLRTLLDLCPFFTVLCSE